MASYSNDRGKRFVSIGAAIPATSDTPNANTTPANNGAGATTGAGDSFAYIPGKGNSFQRPSVLTWDVRTRGAGTYTSRTVNLEGSLNGSDWDVIDQSTSATKESRNLSGEGYVYFRANIPVATPPVVAAGAPVTEVGITI